MTTSCTKIYPDKLADIVREYHYIPRLIRENEYLKRYHRYWSIDSEYYFKIYQTYKVDECEYYSVRYQNALLAEIPYPVDHNSTYDLALDYKFDSHINNLEKTYTCIRAFNKDNNFKLFLLSDSILDELEKLINEY